jgi:hypothetical protein
MRSLSWRASEFSLLKSYFLLKYQSSADKRKVIGGVGLQKASSQRLLGFDNEDLAQGMAQVLVLLQKP